MEDVELKKKTTVIMAAVLLLIGTLVLSYPMISNYVNQRHGSYAIQTLHQRISNTEASELAAQLRQAEQYNAMLLTGTMPENYEDILNIAGGMMGYISIPDLQLDLPIYHGVAEETLAKGVGHMPQSALPVGGEGNHSVLTGHTGLPSAKLFTDLVQLEEGDLFYIHILEDKLTYQVDQIKVVLPSESQDLAAQPKLDLCTLVTCTPYGVNSHRLLVRGQRVETPPSTPQAAPEERDSLSAVYMVAVFALILAAILAAPILLLYFKKRKAE